MMHRSDENASHGDAFMPVKWSNPCIALLILLLVIALSACGASVNTPDIKKNRHPKMRYEITLTIKGSPGPFDEVTGFMQYDVANEQCAPFDKFIGIYHKPPGQSPPIALVPVGANEYKGAIHLDLLQDEDYYGLGVCHWFMTAVVAQLKIGEVTFSPGILQEQIINGQTITQFFPKNAYGDDSIPHRSVLGMSTLDEIDSRYHDEFFSITSSAKELFE